MKDCSTNHAQAMQSLCQAFQYKKKDSLLQIHLENFLKTTSCQSEIGATIIDMDLIVSFCYLFESDLIFGTEVFCRSADKPITT